MEEAAAVARADDDSSVEIHMHTSMQMQMQMQKQNQHSKVDVISVTSDDDRKMPAVVDRQQQQKQSLKAPPPSSLPSSTSPPPSPRQQQQEQPSKHIMTQSARSILSDGTDEEWHRTQLDILQQRRNRLTFPAGAGSDNQQHQQQQTTPAQPQQWNKGGGNTVTPSYSLNVAITAVDELQRQSQFQYQNDANDFGHDHDQNYHYDKQQQHQQQHMYGPTARSIYNSSNNEHISVSNLSGDSTAAVSEIADDRIIQPPIQGDSAMMPRPFSHHLSLQHPPYGAHSLHERHQYFQEAPLLDPQLEQYREEPDKLPPNNPLTRGYIKNSTATASTTHTSSARRLSLPPNQCYDQIYVDDDIQRYRQESERRISAQVQLRLHPSDFVANNNNVSSFAAAAPIEPSTHGVMSVSQHSDIRQQPSFPLSDPEQAVATGVWVVPNSSNIATDANNDLPVAGLVSPDNETPQNPGPITPRTNRAAGQKKKWGKICIWAGLVVVFLAIGVIIGVTVPANNMRSKNTTNNNDSGPNPARPNATAIPTSPPSTNPQLGPRFDLIYGRFLTESPIRFVPPYRSDPGSSPHRNPYFYHYRALQWLSQEDQANYDLETVDLQVLIERYVVALIYFRSQGQQTDGGENRDGAANGGTHEKVPWLAASPTCQWTAPFDAARTSTDCPQTSFSNSIFHCTDHSQTPYIASIKATVPRANRCGSAGNQRQDAKYFSGALVTEIGLLTHLEHFDLAENEMVGTIPTEFGRLTKLTILDFWVNKMSGNVPTELGLLSSLTSLDLESNIFTGSIPTELAELTDLESGFFSHNKLEQRPLKVMFCKSVMQNLEADCLPADLTSAEIVSMTMSSLLDLVECECCTQCCNIESNLCCDLTGGRAFCSPTDYD